MDADYQPARTVELDESRAGQRLDNFLFAQFRQLPKGRVYKMLRKGEVRVNGGRVKQSYRIQAGDKVRLPPVILKPREDSGRAPDSLVEKIVSNIIEINDDLLVLNKPSGIAVHAGSDVKHGVIEILRQARENDAFLELAHRLDRSTSGCLLLARNRQALNQLHELWRSGEITKKYLTLLSGRWHGGIRRLEHQLSSDSNRAQKTRVDPKGKLAIAEFNPLQTFADATLVEVTLETGRTHQIRVQAAEIGHPVLGDDKYGDFKINRAWRKRGLKRLFLHSKMLGFRWGAENKFQTFDSPLPKNLEKLLSTLEQ
ncbi:MAG TPA: 23S rRNA pseudouridine(955/2504/2580) synthase [Gammaproteobacteria bacterium]|nr:23S rRNA pseudouridine(955/2504/2580) synthase [Gammaproteobacteria bacterium]